MTTDPSIDDHVDTEIAECLAEEAPRSFFLYAGAGSGKTRSLVNAVQHGVTTRGHKLALRGQQIAVITFTNAAAEEISSRLEFDPLVRVSTIHSFAWDLIQEFQKDIRDWVKGDLIKTIDQLESQASKAGSKKEAERVHRLQRARNRVSTFDEIRWFTYSPTGENRGQEALNHSQIISLTAGLLTTKPLLGQILATRYPILFIDESQDTNKVLLEAFMHVAEQHHGEFLLGLFGDTMQRIYTDGKADIGNSVPATWAKPVKVMNHRSPERIVQLSNRIRSDIDDHVQKARDDRGNGIARLFIASSDSNVGMIESAVAHQMATITQDPGWSTPVRPDAQSTGNSDVKRLILEHHMAAQRLGFDKLFSALYSLKSEHTSLLDGSIAGLQVFLKQIGPLIDAHGRNDQFSVARIVREHSPLMATQVLKEASQRKGTLQQILDECQASVDQITQLWNADATPTLGDIAAVLDATELFPLAPAVRTALVAGILDDGDEATGTEIEAWQACLAAPFSELTHYDAYIKAASPFATHQGVKGLEFPRVMVVISDAEAHGFMFSYEKLLGAKSLTETDTKNQAAGKDSSLDRTRRLMYVTCSRASQSLAIVAYTQNPAAVRSFAIDNNWFSTDEIVLL